MRWLAKAALQRALGAVPQGERLRLVGWEGSRVGSDCRPRRAEGRGDCCEEQREEHSTSYGHRDLLFLGGCEEVTLALSILTIKMALRGMFDDDTARTGEAAAAGEISDCYFTD
jgi:hypothetical protein